ncbi:MAG: hypothetical protein AAF125_12215, partial [Chloroflexota bacterium]
MTSTTSPLPSTATTQTRQRVRWGALLFGVVMLFSVALGTGLRLTVINGHLPYLEHHDEFKRVRNTMHIRHDAPPIAEDWGVYLRNYEGYPPVQLWVHAVTQRMVEARVLFPYPGDYVLGARYAALAANVLTTAFLVWAGWAAARPLGIGWAAFVGG